MDAIINFFEGLGDILLSLVDFVVSFFSDLVWIIQTLTWAMSQIPSLLSWIPEEILVIILGTLSVVVIYKIMGREG